MANDPSQAAGAQIPLQTFHLPAFPPSAAGLKALTLTSAIPLDDYPSLLLASSDTPAFSIPPLPPAIESLTLELFALGFPAGFLAALATALPNLKSLVVYSQLFAGTSEASTADAIEFFKRARGLRAVHFLDVFARPGFFARAGRWMRWSDSEVDGEARRGLMFLEVNYTFRDEDEEFMAKIPVTEVPELIGPGLVSCSFNVAPPEEEEGGGQDEQGSVRRGDGVGAQGIMAFNKTMSDAVVKRLVDKEGGTWPMGLRALNLTFYTLAIEQLSQVLKKCDRVMVLNVTVDIEPGEETKKGILKALESCKALEQVEIVANPIMSFFVELQNPQSSVFSETFPSKADMEALAGKCPKLASLKVNVLRATSLSTVVWEKKDSKWSGGVKEGHGLAIGT